MILFCLFCLMQSLLIWNRVRCFRNGELNELVKHLQEMGKETKNRPSTKRDKGSNSESRITKTDSVETKSLSESSSAAPETKVVAASPLAVNVQATPSDVTKAEKLEILAEFYSQCILGRQFTNYDRFLAFDFYVWKFCWSIFAFLGVQNRVVAGQTYQ